MNRILLIINLSNDFDRSMLRGIVRYSKENGPWLFYRLPYYTGDVRDGEKSIIKWAKEWKADAIFGRWSDGAEDLLKELDIPVVLQNYHHRSTTYSNLTGNYIGTGKMAAEFFKRRLFRNYAFFGIKGVVWSDERCEGFRREVEPGCGIFYRFEYENELDSIRPQVSEWLRELPKPVALFCCDDAHALFISETCRMDNIAIPAEVALLGVDNDDLVCNISDPPISSIELEVEKGGYAVGRLLDLQIKKAVKGQFNVVINPTRLELRQSTERYNIKDPHILKIVETIEGNLSSELRVENLISGIPYSRRNIELKFKREMRTSIYQYILERKVNRMADLLQSTDYPLAVIASEAGFSDYNNIARIFKKFKGCSPQEYRQRKSIRQK